MDFYAALRVSIKKIWFKRVLYVALPLPITNIRRIFTANSISCIRHKLIKNELLYFYLQHVPNTLKHLLLYFSHRDNNKPPWHFLIIKFSFSFFFHLFFLPFLSLLLCNFIELALLKSDPSVEFMSSKKNGGKLLVINGIRFFRNRQRNGKQYWKCSFYYRNKCPTIAIVQEDTYEVKILHDHKHHTADASSKH